MLDHVMFWVNGRRHEVRGPAAFLSLSDYLRRELSLTGTKIVCSEGDCGACSVLVGRPIDESVTVDSPTAVGGSRLVYRPIDSCIQFVFQLDGTHIVTIEGLGGERDPSAVQSAMIEHHGSQCGYCTPGFVVAMTGLLEDRDRLDAQNMRCGLTGNLCRCTGYTPIIDAGLNIDPAEHQRLEDRYPSGEMRRAMAERRLQPITLSAEWNDETHTFISPPDLAAALKSLAENPQATIVAGATDIGVRINKSQKPPATTVDLNRVSELVGIHNESNELVIGARTSWSEVERATQDAFPEFHKIIQIFGAPQIRHVGTIGGNIANASPIADSLPFLYVVEARLELQSIGGTREVNINNFYHGYKKFDLRPGELITKIRIPLPAADEILRLYKVSRRRDLDIATFTAAIRLRLNGDTITSAAIAFGAVGPTVLRAHNTEAFLRGRPLDEITMRAAGDVAIAEITPITDVRGAADFRYQLTRNVLLKFFHETQSQLTLA